MERGGSGVGRARPGARSGDSAQAYSPRHVRWRLLHSGTKLVALQSSWVCQLSFARTWLTSTRRTRNRLCALSTTPFLSPPGATWRTGKATACWGRSAAQCPLTHLPLCSSCNSISANVAAFMRDNVTAADVGVLNGNNGSTAYEVRGWWVQGTARPIAHQGVTVWLFLVRAAN